VVIKVNMQDQRNTKKIKNQKILVEKNNHLTTLISVERYNK
jgi:hypothetical protein